MLNPEELIKSINKKCEQVFADSKFFLYKYKNGIYRISGLDAYAINNNRNAYEKVKVLNWFSDFWIFVEMSFKSNNTFITISIFQGQKEDENKHQLFRAEWDDYNNPEEKHPQPHWHITSNQVIEKSFKEYSKNFDDGNFLSVLRNIETEIIDVKKIHFAMNGNWQNNENHIHQISNDDRIIKWFIGVLFHLKEELTFVSDK
jgi:hypothetical protein